MRVKPENLHKKSAGLGKPQFFILMATRDLPPPPSSYVATFFQNFFSITFFATSLIWIKISLYISKALCNSKASKSGYNNDISFIIVLFELFVEK